MLTRSTVASPEEGISDIGMTQGDRPPMTVISAVKDLNIVGIEWEVLSDRDGDMMVVAWDEPCEVWEVLYIG